MADQNVGTVYYEVDADTSKLIASLRNVADQLEGAQRSMGKTDQAADKLTAKLKPTAAAVQNLGKEAGGAGSAMSGLVKIIGAYLSLRTLQSAIELSDQYGQMASRIKNATSSAEEYQMVQERLLATANGTYRALAEAQEVYLSTADSLRDMGYTTAEVLDITDSFSYALVRDAARADQATNAMDAYSKALMKGKVEADGWASIMAATPSIVNGIAEATGRTTAEIKKLGADGKLSVEALNEGLRISREENKALADTMEVSVKDSFTALTNAMQVFIGKVNQSSGASNQLTSNVALLAQALQDPATIQAAQDLAAGVVGAFKTIIEGTKEVVKFVQWAADSMAAAMHGPAAGDVVRISDALDDAKGRAKMLEEEMGKMRLFRLNPFLSESELKAEYQKTKKEVDKYQTMLEDAGKPKLPAPGQTEAPGAPPAPRRKVSAEVADSAKSQKAALSEAEKAAKSNAAAIRKLEEDLVLAALAGEELARTQAALTLNPYATPEQIDQIKGLASELYRLKEGAKNAEVITDLEQNLKLAALSGEELAVAQAKLRLNQYATPEQVQQVEDLARAIFKANEATAARQQFGTGKKAEEYIRGQVSPLSGGQFDDQMARYDAERVAEEARYAAQLERLTQARELQIETNRSYDELEAQYAQEHADRLVQIQQAKDMLLLQSGQKAFDGIAGVMKTAFGEQSALYRAAFAVSKAFAIAQSVVAIQTGLANAASLPFPGNLAAMATVASNTASIIGTIMGANMGGGRQYGGPVQPGSMYRVNETGKPEILNTASGRQYLIPNSRGDVVSNADAVSAQGGAGSSNSVTVNQTIVVQGQVDGYTARQLERKAAMRQQLVVGRLGRGAS